MPSRFSRMGHTLALAVLLIATPAAATVLTRGPYLQLLTTPSVTIVWNPDRPAPCVLAIGPRGGPTTLITGTTRPTRARSCHVPTARSPDSAPCRRQRRSNST